MVNHDISRDILCGKILTHRDPIEKRLKKMYNIFQTDVHTWLCIYASWFLEFKQKRSLSRKGVKNTPGRISTKLSRNCCSNPTPIFDASQDDCATVLPIVSWNDLMVASTQFGSLSRHVLFIPYLVVCIYTSLKYPQFDSEFVLWKVKIVGNSWFTYGAFPKNFLRLLISSFRPHWWSESEINYMYEGTSTTTTIRNK